MKVIVDLPSLYEAHNFFYPRQKVYTNLEGLRDSIESTSTSDKKLDIYAVMETDIRKEDRFAPKLEEHNFKVIKADFRHMKLSPKVGDRDQTDFSNTSPIVTFLMSKFAFSGEDKVMVVTNKFEPFCVMQMILKTNPSFQLQICFFLDLLDARWMNCSESKNSRFLSLSDYRQDIFGQHEN